MIKRVSRRTILRGAGAVAVSLPCLEAMVPALQPKSFGMSSAVNADVPKRMVVMSAGLGFHAQHLFPGSEGKLSDSTPYLAKLSQNLDQLTLLSGLSHPEQQGNNGHASGLTFLTTARRPGLAGFKNTISLDQLIASQIGPQTRYPCLVLSTRNGGSLSWTASGVSIPGESSPAKLFKKLFIEGTPEEIEKEMAGLKRGRSILDTVSGRARELEESISGADREKLDEYLGSVRELETRLQLSEGWVKRPKPSVESSIPTDIADQNEAIERQRLLYDIIVLALQTDSTRTVTFDLGGLNSVPKVAGVSNDWHGLSHHGKDPAKIQELKLIEEAEFAVFNEFLGKLKAIPEKDNTLLDNTAVLFGSNLGNASSHDWRNLPILVAGGGFRHGNYVAHDAENNTPLANLFVTLAQHMGIEIDSFGSSTAASVRGIEK
ncbi:MAG: DUF1552 domain-containing protein [Planctomycetota bacterium]